MRLKAIKLANFCQHRELTIDFPPGITGILGGNGRGKSNIIKAVKFAIRGTSGNTGKKLDDLNWAAANSNESGYVELSFEANGTAGVIKRFINTAKATLKYGETSYGSAGTVDDAMLAITGVTPRTLDEIVFVMQGKIEGILFERPADRAAKFQGLFGTENAEKLRKLLADEMALIAVDSLADRISELERELATSIDPALQTLNAQQQQLNGAMADHDIQSIDTTITSFENDLNLRKQLELLDAKYKSALTSIDLKSAISETEKQLDRFSTKLQADKQVIDDAKTQVATAKSSQMTKKAVDGINVEIQRCTAQLSEVPIAAPAVTREQITDSESALLEASTEVEQNKRFISALENKDQPICPLCQQVVVNAEQRLDEARKLVATRGQLVANVTMMLMKAKQELEAYDRLIAIRLARQEMVESTLARYKAKLTEFNDVKFTTVDQAAINALEAKINEYNVLETTYKTRCGELQVIRERYAKATGELDSIIAQQQSLTGQLLNITAEAYDAAKASKKLIDGVKLQLAGIDGQLKQLHSRRVQLLTELTGLKAQAGSSESKKKYRDLCDKARALLHRDVLPQKVVQHYIRALNERLNSYLYAFNIQFGCMIKDDLSVVCTIPGVGERDAARLSGGQQVMLGIAFRFATYSLFAAKLGFVVLDEPTVMLDPEHVNMVATVMNTVRQHAHNAGLQLIVVTHEPQLEVAFDRIIRL